MPHLLIVAITRCHGNRTHHKGNIQSTKDGEALTRGRPADLFICLVSPPRYSVYIYGSARACCVWFLPGKMTNTTGFAFSPTTRVRVDRRTNSVILFLPFLEPASQLPG
ncbi:hypothetical protein DPEC_G00291900 [Dallia pectoralis]|uniref:Uncharacterized protein n=1 Tax=Dallia pectoralis TaxID=75939 RepID=A0ACC2FHR3_DALPE|nr:hypothetical protein DPEC_G00291900 [Dallia pectoralis]